MSDTPVLDKYPFAHQAATDALAFAGVTAPARNYLADFEHAAGILESCMASHPASCETMIVACILTSISPASYTKERLDQVSGLYGDTVGGLVKIFAQGSDSSDFSAASVEGACINKVWDIIYLETQTPQRAAALPAAFYEAYAKALQHNTVGYGRVMTALSEREKTAFENLKAQAALARAVAPQQKPPRR